MPGGKPAGYEAALHKLHSSMRKRPPLAAAERDVFPHLGELPHLILRRGKRLVRRRFFDGARILYELDEIPWPYARCGRTIRGHSTR